MKMQVLIPLAGLLFLKFISNKEKKLIEVVCLNPLGGSFVSKIEGKVKDVIDRIQESLNPLGGSFVSKIQRVSKN